MKTKWAFLLLILVVMCLMPGAVSAAALPEGDTPHGTETNSAEALLDADLSLFKDTMAVPFESGSFEYAFETYIENTSREELDGFLKPFSREYLEANKKFLESEEFLLMKPELQENNINFQAALENSLKSTSEVALQVNQIDMTPYGLTKDALRASFILAANDLRLNPQFYVTGALLRHACQDYPSAQYFGSGTAIVNKMLESPQFHSKYSDFLNYHRRTGRDQWSDSIGCTSPLDLYLGVHKMDCAFRMSTLNCSFFDQYNFEHWAFERDIRQLPYNFVVLINNYGYLGLQKGALNQYDINVLFRYSRD